MNAPLRLFAQATSIKSLLACACASALLGGCAVTSPFATAPVTADSVVAADVARISRTPGEFPEFTDIPPIPKDQRPVAQWGVAASQLTQAGTKLDRDTADNTWTLTGTDRFQTRALQQAGPPAQSEGSSTAASEAFARQLRERATPPPSPRD